jgi:hypothetical protein
MGLFDGFEKLINEHGSAVILKERIALANDKYVALEQKLSVSELRTNNLESENQSLRLDTEKAHAQIRNLEEQLAESHLNALTLKYGVYWDKDGNPFCPKCKTPTSQVKWATYENRQVHGMKCSCTDKPFVLMENGEPIQAQEAMKRMANA